MGNSMWCDVDPASTTPVDESQLLYRLVFYLFIYSPSASMGGFLVLKKKKEKALREGESFHAPASRRPQGPCLLLRI
jgi:hypothetical protein